MMSELVYYVEKDWAECNERQKRQKQNRNRQRKNRRSLPKNSLYKCPRGNTANVWRRGFCIVSPSRDTRGTERE